MKNTDETLRLLLALNCLAHKDASSVGFYRLVKKGFKVVNLWQIITTFKTDQEYQDETAYLLTDKARVESSCYVTEILEYRSLKSSSIRLMNYSDSKIYYELEIQKMKDLLMYLRGGNQDVFCLINERVVDKLLPHLYRFN